MAEGTKAAVELAMQAVAAAGEDWDAGEPELDLGLPEPKTAEGRAIVERRRGRPPGSRNKRTQQTVARLLAQYEDPRAVLLAIAQAPVEELVERMGCKPMEALQEKRLAAIGVLPYVAQRQPLAVDVTNHKVVHLTIVDGQVAQASDGDDLGIALDVVHVLDGEYETVENQEVSEGGGNEV